ncbi:hypothetical protein CDAR_534731 [Caerostris darwini]|uniref:Uncharacterized protein n=1 Tax=Caerostris darwini TaxID=1538125 RepID=A0AAV4UHR1_9ARAC|nr:hypothetical protein CDAR_534731 [Caerostris darwini]
MADDASGVCRQQRSKSLPATYFRTVSNGGLWQIPEEENCSHEDSPAQKKRWWQRRRSAAGKIGATDSGRSAPLPYTRQSRQSDQESGGSCQESGGSGQE